MVTSDLRFQTLNNMVFQRLGELEYEYLVTTVWSLGICTSAFGLEMQAEQKLRLLSVLNQHLDNNTVSPGSIYNIPSLVFSISCFFTEEDMNQLVQDTVERLSILYGKSIHFNLYAATTMLERMDLLNCSSMLMGWARCDMRNEELLDKVA